MDLLSKGLILVLLTTIIHGWAGPGSTATVWLELNSTWRNLDFRAPFCFLYHYRSQCCFLQNWTRVSRKREIVPQLFFFFFCCSECCFSNTLFKVKGRYFKKCYVRTYVLLRMQTLLIKFNKLLPTTEREASKKVLLKQFFNMMVI